MRSQTSSTQLTCWAGPGQTCQPTPSTSPKRILSHHSFLARGEMPPRISIASNPVNLLGVIPRRQPQAEASDGRKRLHPSTRAARDDGGGARVLSPSYIISHDSCHTAPASASPAASSCSRSSRGSDLQSRRYPSRLRRRRARRSRTSPRAAQQRRGEERRAPPRTPRHHLGELPARSARSLSSELADLPAPVDFCCALFFFSK